MPGEKFAEKLYKTANTIKTEKDLQRDLTLSKNIINFCEKLLFPDLEKQANDGEMVFEFTIEKVINQYVSSFTYKTLTKAIVNNYSFDNTYFDNYLSSNGFKYQMEYERMDGFLKYNYIITWDKKYSFDINTDETKNERRKVTPSVRYNILRRDNFKCCLCGRGVSDGVKLEIDHIIPISKGGLSVYDNLRTLCFDCNRGKGTKIE